ncbi:FAD-dependent thymidylate synthase [Tepidiforma sp.]|uniref:FAD-dependent thymidylate synthase n=1 Tax=Tepidiforma sp. TaxID=2682230 RepID=UPI002ADD369A|nr:FAD-dependent thymidylate synthase [Tepidiforma sp.]
MAIQVTLLSHSPDPLRSLYMAYRTCYSSLTPQQVARRIEDERITRETMEEFVRERLKTGHVSPLEQVWFEFAISGVSRAFSHQFVRHRVGISFEQQSQRYVTYKRGEFPYTVPETVRKAGMEGEMRELFERVGELYEAMVEAGVPAEDARFLLPNATNTNFKITVNFASLLHICDLRLCTRAQWEFRKVAALMRAEVMRVDPILGRMLQPKCGELRLGYCDETEKDWAACPIGRVRPHKEVLFRIYEQYRKGELQPLREEDWAAIEAAEEPEPEPAGG